MPGSEKFSVPSELQVLESKVPPPPLQISSEGDDRMVANIKTEKKSLDQKLTPKKFHPEFSSLNYFVCTLFAELPGWDTRKVPQIWRLFWIPPPPPKKTPSLIKPPKKYLPNFPNQKKSGNRKFQTLKSASIIPVKWNPRVKAAFSSSLTILCRQLGCWGRKSKQKI